MTEKQEQYKTDLMVIKKETADLVLTKVQVFQRNKELDLPPNFSPSNALKSAWLILQNTLDKTKRPVLEVCTKASIANALLDTVVQGLNPAKKQCYYIAYGNQLTMQRSYLGTKAVCLRVDKSLYDIYAEPVYKGDNLEYTIIRGQRIIEKHTQKLENIDDANIVAAYAVAIEKDGKVRRCELMTMDQIKKAWAQSKMNPINDKGDIKADSTHGKFTAEMAKRTVISRMAKHIIGASDDSDLLIQSVRRTDDQAAAAEAQAEVDENANQEVIDIEHHTENGNGSGAEQPEEPKEEGLTDKEKAVIEAEEAAEAEAAATSGPGF